MNLSKTLNLFAAVAFITISRLPAQPVSLKFDHIGLEQGLSQSTVNAIVQDAQGFMWFGTQDGLNRYDGYSITIFKNIPEDQNSISNNCIRSLLCDSRGDLWIGTEGGGLNRYVYLENKFYHYKFRENDTTALSENQITALFEDSRKNIWIGTREGGLNLLNRNDWTFRSFLNHKGDTTAQKGNTVWKICEDNSGRLWVATERGLFRLNLDQVNGDYGELQFTQYVHIPLNSNSLSSNSVFSLHCDRNDNLLIGTWGAGLNIFNKQSDTFTHYKHDAKKPASVSGNIITSIHEDPNGLLWIGTYDGGLNLFNNTAMSFEKYIDESIISLYEDRSGIIWIGTFAGGVRVFDSRKNKFLHYYDDSNNLNDLRGNLVFTILMDRDNELWVGTWNDGLNRFDKGRRKITSYNYDPKNNYSLGSDRVYALCETPDGNIWVGTMSGGLNCFEKKTGKFTRYKHNRQDQNSVRSNDISALYYDQQLNLLWIGYISGGISSYDPSINKFKHFNADGNSKSLSGSAVTVIYKGKKSGLWIGTLSQGANRFIPESNSFKHYQVSAEFNPENISGWQKSAAGTSVNNDGILSIFEDEDGIVWIGTYGGGLNRFDNPAGLFTYYTSQYSFPSDIIYGIRPDKLGYLWLSSNKGLIHFNPKTKTFRNFDVSDGLQSNEFNQGAYFSSPDGELFFGGINGFNSFFPEEIEDNNYIPPVSLTIFRVFNKVLPLPNPIPTNTRIELSYYENFFSFEFVALNYTSSEKNQYAYFLEEFDNDWHYVSAEQRYASYTNLDPGEYILRVKGSNNDGLWNEAGTSITIIIKPPFWMTWWFKGLGILFIAGIVTAGAAQRMSILHRRQKTQEEISRRLIEKEEQERKRIAGELHDSIGQELIVIKNRAESNEMDGTKAIEQLRKISEIATSALNSVRNISYNLRPYELDRIGLTQALSGMIRRVAETTSIEFAVEIEKIDQLFTPEQEINIFRIIQESLNNILKHAAAKQVVIQIEKRESERSFGKVDEIYIKIADNGKGFDPEQELELFEQRKGFGLPGLMERIRILGAAYKLHSFPGAGTELIIRVPLKKNTS